MSNPLSIKRYIWYLPALKDKTQIIQHVHFYQMLGWETGMIVHWLLFTVGVQPISK
jgi:hypothetical protein